MVLQHALVAFSVAAILAPFSYYMGLIARVLRLPQITGYLVSGIMCGPYLLGILSKESVLDLNIIEGACLSIIGLAAGAEIHLSDLSRSKKQVRATAAACCLVHMHTVTQTPCNAPSEGTCWERPVCAACCMAFYWRTSSVLCGWSLTQPVAPLACRP